MKLTNTILWIYIIFSIFFLLVDVPNITNYMEFYRALEKCQAQIYKVSLDVRNLINGIVYLNITFNITNPTGFSGLKISTATCNVRYFTSNNEQKQLPGLTETFSNPIEIPPNGNALMTMKFTFKFEQNQETIRELIAFLTTKPKKVNFIFMGQYVLNAYSYSFAMPMGPFSYSVELNM